MKGKETRLMNSGNRRCRQKTRAHQRYSSAYNEIYNEDRSHGNPPL